MIKKEQIKDCIADAEISGHNVTVRDICYCLLLYKVADIDIAYKALYGQTTDTNAITLYNDSAEIEYIKNYIKDNFKDKIITESASYNDISSAENKEAILNMLDELDDDIRNELIDKDKSYKIRLDLRTKLESLFSKSVSNEQQVILVNTKYNAICPHCRREFTKEMAVLTICPHCKEGFNTFTKEDAKKQFNLTEK